MIDKGQLEELIKQGATIYTTYGGYISEINLHNKYDYVTDNYLFEANMVAGEVGYRKYPFNMLFETREEAEWHKEFGNIERTERLVLPTWEEIEKDFNAINKFGTYPVVEFNSGYMDIFVDNYSKKFIVVTAQPRKPLTKENYTVACRKAKELFLGEKK